MSLGAPIGWTLEEHLLHVHVKTHKFSNLNSFKNIQELCHKCLPLLSFNLAQEWQSLVVGIGRTPCVLGLALLQLERKIERGIGFYFAKSSI